MKKKPILIMVTTFLFLAVSNFVAGEETSIPYNHVNKAMMALKSREFKGVDCVPWYVKDSRKGIIFDPEKALFRIRTWEGFEIPLEIESLSSVPADQLADYEKKLIKEDGFTHRIWIPKAEKRFQDGDIVHSLPKGSVQMSQAVSIVSKPPAQ